MGLLFFILIVGGVGLFVYKKVNKWMKKKERERVLDARKKVMFPKADKELNEMMENYGTNRKDPKIIGFVGPYSSTTFYINEEKGVTFVSRHDGVNYLSYDNHILKPEDIWQVDINEVDKIVYVEDGTGRKNHCIIRLEAIVTTSEEFPNFVVTRLDYSKYEIMAPLVGDSSHRDAFRDLVKFKEDLERFGRMTHSSVNPTPVQRNYAAEDNSARLKEIEEDEKWAEEQARKAKENFEYEQRLAWESAADHNRREGRDRNDVRYYDDLLGRDYDERVIEDKKHEYGDKKENGADIGGIG